MTAKSPQNPLRKKNGRRNTRSVTEILSDVLEPVLARKTGMKLDLVRAWPELAGQDYAQTTRPEKINWPKRRNDDDPFEPGVLVVACDPAAALFFQHEQAQTIERVNLFFGFEAVARIKILQKPVFRSDTVKTSKTAAPMTVEDQKRLKRIVDQIDDDDLRAKLSKLGKGVFAKKHRESR